MTNEMTDEKYYEALVDMFATDGWKVFKEEMKANGVVINSVEATKDSDDMFFRKGQLNIIGSILSLEDTVDRMMTEGSNDSL